MLVEELLKLPPWIDFEGINFEFQLINNGSEIRLTYHIKQIAPDSPHKHLYDDCGGWCNTFTDKENPPLQGFLILYEGIETDTDLCWAARDCLLKLVKMGVIDAW